MEQNKLDLVLDSSTLINLFFGRSKVSRNIHTIISSYERTCITNIVRYEFRNYFLDFFRFIEVYESIIKDVEENKIIIYKTFSDLLEELSRKFHRTPQRYGRIRMIYEEILEEYQKTTLEIMIRGLKKSDDIEEILIDRLKTIIWDYKIKLKILYEDIGVFTVINDFDCSLCNWKYFYDANMDEFILNEKRTCSKICLNIKEKILDFKSKNQIFINQILVNYVKLSKKRAIRDYDKKIIPVLQKITNREKVNIGVKDCKVLGDFFISSIIDNNHDLLTNNKNHFLLLLLCKNRENSLITF